MQLLYKARDITEAHILAGMLRANGIEAFVGGHYLQGGVGELAPLDFATIFVEEADLARARALLDEYESAPVADEDGFDLEAGEPPPDEGQPRHARLIVALLVVAVGVASALLLIC